MTTPEQLHYAFTEVPDYDMASRGFLGGGIPPLSSMTGLPSYETAAAERDAERRIAEQQRSFSEPDLAGLFMTAQNSNSTIRARSRSGARLPQRTLASARVGGA